MAKLCSSCGKEIADGAAFCTECGAQASQAQPQAQPQACPQAQPQAQPQTQIPTEEPVKTAPQTPQAPPVRQAPPVQRQGYQQQQSYQQQGYQQSGAPAARQEVKPVGGKYGIVGTGAFLGLTLLFSVPVVGWIACIIISFAAKNENIKHYARAMMIWLIVGIVVSAAMFFLFRWLSGALMNYINQATDGAFDSWKDLFNQFKNGDFSGIPME